MENSEIKPSLNFIEQIIEKDIEEGIYGGRVHTRFPPEPNGYLHIGHAKAICLSFELAEKYNGLCNLRFDDTNPVKEESHFVESIKRDIRWLGFDWKDREYYASDYFGQLYEWAIQLIKTGKAYVDDLTADEIRQYRGTLIEAGKESPYRDRPAEENLDLFEKMKKGNFTDGEKVLRAKIDMASPNLNMRDPVMYRILHAHHHRTGNEWCIYPMYDWAHGQSDSVEKITHSLCSLEFEDHRPLYDWFTENLGIFRPKQREFARLNLNYTIMSKRKLLQLVEGRHVDGWDDPRMQTLSGLRRRGFSPESIKNFIHRIGVAKRNMISDISVLEFSVREDLNKRARRRMAVLDPLKVVITNYDDEKTEWLDAVNNPEDESMGTRKIPFSKEIYIERADFMEDAPRKFFRLSVGREVRLRYAYFITCNDIEKDKNGKITTIFCTYDPLSKGGKSPDGRKVKGTLHWVSAKHGFNTEIRLYDRLFKVEDPENVKEGQTFIDNINPDSINIIENAILEPALKDAKTGDYIQFERNGYFCVDSKFAEAGTLVFNRTVALRDSWAKIAEKKR
jgi:glutaminyl-tRNA synthetase